ncbi:MAG: hypothetical protein EOO01_37810, partial [Chitinophagaceae bacterium]
MKKLLFIALACYGLTARAQMRESRDFLYLYSDSIVYANHIKFQPDFSGNLRVQVDSRNFPIAQVKFLSTNDGYFANARRIGLFTTEAFLERIMEGRINVFQERPPVQVPFLLGALALPGTHYGAESSRPLSLYYNKGFEDVKNLNYNNLKRDLADNPKSMDMLLAYKRGKNLSTMAYIAGAASIVGAAMVATSDGRNAYSTGSFTASIGLGALGLGLVAGGYFKDVSN